MPGRDPSLGTQSECPDWVPLPAGGDEGQTKLALESTGATNLKRNE